MSEPRQIVRGRQQQTEPIVRRHRLGERLSGQEQTVQLALNPLPPTRSYPRQGHIERTRVQAGLGSGPLNRLGNDHLRARDATLSSSNCCLQ
jgi:hypothetical protein